MDEIEINGIRIFGSKENFDSWMNSKNFALGSVKPKDLIKTPEGIEIVKDTLDGLSWGSYM